MLPKSGSFFRAFLAGGAALALLAASAADLVVTTQTTVASGTYDRLVATADVDIPTGTSVVISGTKTSYVATGLCNQATLTVGGDLRFTGIAADYEQTSLAVGHLGATGRVIVAAGGSLLWQPAVTNGGNYRFRCACNKMSEADRLQPSYAVLDIAGTLCAPYLELAAFFPSNGTRAVAADVTLREGGLLEASAIGVNDRSQVRITCLGGTIRAGHALNEYGANFFVGSIGLLDIQIAEGANLVFDTAGRDISLSGVNQRTLSGAGGLVKRGAGTLTITLGSSNSFTGNIRVEAGSLALGRPLAADQTVTVAEGASFQPYTPADLGQVVYEGTATRSAWTVQTSIASGGLDLKGISEEQPFYGDRLCGPQSGTTAVTGTVTHVDLSAASPFQFLGSGGTLELSGSGLVDEPLAFRSGTTRFAEVRHQGADDFLQVDAGATAIFEKIFLSDEMRPAVFAQTNGSLRANTGFYVGYAGGTGTLDVANTSVACGWTLALGGSEQPERRAAAGRVTVTNGTITCGCLDFSGNSVTNGTDFTTVVNEVRLRTGSIVQTGSIVRHDDPAARIRFAGGKLQSNWGIVTNAFFTSGDKGRLWFEGDAEHDILWDQQGFHHSFFAGTGWLITTGACDFVRKGTGTLRLRNSNGGHLVWNHTGATRFEGGGTVEVWGQNLLPYGPGHGHLVVGSGVTLDLRGQTTTLNGLDCAGVLTNSSATAATLALGADNADLDYAVTPSAGTVDVVKVGTGTMTLKAQPNGGLTVEAGTVVLPRRSDAGFRHYRLKMEKAAGSGCNSMQIAEVKLLCDGEDVTGLRSGFGFVSGTSSDYPGGEIPANALDGSLDTKYLDFRLAATRAASDGTNIYLQIDYAAPQRVTHYTWATANDCGSGSGCRDLSDWRFLGSDDGQTWYELDAVTGYVATEARKTWVGTNFVCAADVPWTLPGALTVEKGARLEVAPGVRLTCASVQTAGGTVDLGAGATLDVVEDGEGCMRGTTLAGAAEVVKRGTGTLTVFGTTAFSGRLDVREGTLTGCALPIVSNEWYRFTFKKAKASYGGNWIVQLSELKLFDEDGNRVCTDLAEASLGTAATDLARGSVAMEQTGGTWYYSHEGPSKLFDGNTATKLCIVNSSMSNATEQAHWRSIVIRTAAGTPPIASYLFTSGGDTLGSRNPSNWAVETSADGETWVLLDQRDDPETPNANLVDFNDGIPYWFEQMRQSGGTTFTAEATVAVAAGATLELLGGTTAIGALEIDLTAGAGTITEFTPASSGVLALSNLPAGTALRGLVLPITITTCRDRANLRTWSVTLDGQPVRGVKVSFAGGALTLSPDGCVIFVR